jgi:hypothetical protein
VRDLIFLGRIRIVGEVGEGVGGRGRAVAEPRVRRAVMRPHRRVGRPLSSYCSGLLEADADEKFQSINDVGDDGGPVAE